VLAFGGVADACAYYPTGSQSWGNRPENPNRFNVQVLCQYLMTREGAPASLYEPGQPSADEYNYNVFGGRTFFPASIGITEGNPNLDSEEADTDTFGVVLSPTQSLTLSVDWYRIKLKRAIGTPSHDAIYQQCLDAAFNPLIGDAPGAHTGAELAAANPFCALIQREYVGGVPLTPGNFGADRKFSAQYINQGGIESEGYDVQAVWGRSVGSAGSFNMNIQASFLDRYATSPFPGADFIEYTGTTNNNSFDYSLLSNFAYSRSSLTVGLRWQHLPSLDPAPDAAPNTLGVDAHDQFDLYGSWSFGDRYQLRGGIDNLFNAEPEWVGRTTMRNLASRGCYAPRRKPVLEGRQVSRRWNGSSSIVCGHGFDEGTARPREPAHDGSDRHAENARRVLVGKPFRNHQHQRVALRRR
jgi:outer membrane receptor protein involved in Fe transport